ncbi:MAG: hypothetical protein ACRD8A_00415 [Candidatus Acidiferrales bacterium]
MSQIFHIFRKDVRQHWIEISAALVVLALYVWHQPAGGSVTTGFDVGSVFQSLSWRALPYLVPIAWCLLIVRTVQAESLVGDRQFWVTRPYRWPALLAAKCLLVLAFLNVPLFIADLVLLERSGFSIAPYVTGLLYMQLMILVILVLPVLMASAITSTITQVVLLALAAIAYMIGVDSLTSNISGAQVMVSDPFAGSAIAILPLAFVAIVLLQYARRKTWQSRTILLCAVGLSAIFLIVTPYPALVAKTYPLAKNGEPPLVRLAFEPASEPPNTTTMDLFPTQHNDIELSVPIRVSGVDQKSVVIEHAFLITMNGPKGLRWNSGWKPAGGSLWAETTRSRIDFSLNRDFFERVKSTPITLQMSLALVQYRETNPRTILAGPETLSLPNRGKCAMRFQATQWTTCWAALKPPSFIAVINGADTTCPATSKKQTTARTGFAISGVWDSTSPAYPGISPITEFPLNFTRADDANVFVPFDQQIQAPRICPGTPITFYSPRFSRASRAELTINEVRPGDFVLEVPQAPTSTAR